MLVVLPTHQGDVHLLEKLLLWMEKLDGKLEHDCLLVFDRDTPFDAATACHAIASRLFRRAEVTATRQSVRGWPHGPNSLFFHAAKYIHGKWRVPFLVIEPDAIPLRPGWLDDLSIAYLESGKPHMGFIENVTQAGLPEKVMSGVAVYSAEVGALPLLAHRAWNTDLADLLVPDAHHTPLIKDFFGTKNQPPFFVEHKRPDSPINALTLDFIPPEAVLFHRDKTHSMIPLLAKRLNIAWQAPRIFREKIVVVMPVCHRDIGLALAHAQWLRVHNHRWEHRCVISYDPTCPNSMVEQLRIMLAPCFQEVALSVYPTPPIPQYPQVANWAFQSAAHRMSQQNAPWLFLEPDSVVLRTDWLEQLQAEYEVGGKSWMGPHVKGMSHANGVMVYPADAAHRMPRAMSCGAGEAFDMVAAGDIMHDCHDCDHLLFHTWSILNGEWCPVGGGHVPVNITVDLARKIPKSAVAIHRVKDNSLINLLMSGAWRP